VLTAAERTEKGRHATRHHTIGDRDAGRRGPPSRRTAPICDRDRGASRPGRRERDRQGSIDIWTAGDLIRRIAVDQPGRRTMIEFYDFGTPVTITVPPGF
jgi:hypothetical protein